MATRSGTPAKRRAALFLATLALAFGLASAARDAGFAASTRRLGGGSEGYPTAVDAQLAVAELEQNPALLFDRFMRDHGKVYQSEAERSERFEVFVANIQVAKALNAQRSVPAEAVFGVSGPFADLSPEEFHSKMLMGPQPDPSPLMRASAGRTELELTVAPGDVPDSWDWRDHGAVTRVKNQGAVGTCWAFSATGSIEAQFALSKAGKLVDLSTAQIVDCDATMFPGNDTGDCGPNGGFPFSAYEYVLQAGGIETWESYPYCVGDFSCVPCAPQGWNVTICGHGIPMCNHKDDCANKFDASKIATAIDSWAWLSPDKNETHLVQQM